VFITNAQTCIIFYFYFYFVQELLTKGRDFLTRALHIAKPHAAGRCKAVQ